MKMEFEISDDDLQLVSSEDKNVRANNNRVH